MQDKIETKTQSLDILVDVWIIKCLDHTLVSLMNFGYLQQLQHDQEVPSSILIWRLEILTLISNCSSDV